MGTSFLERHSNWLGGIFFLTLVLLVAHIPLTIYDVYPVARMLIVLYFVAYGVILFRGRAYLKSLSKDMRNLWIVPLIWGGLCIIKEVHLLIQQ